MGEQQSERIFPRFAPCMRLTKQWECKKTRTAYSDSGTKLHALRKRSNLIPGYLVRYADDFVIITNTRSHAESWKARLQEFLQSKMKLTLSQKKTLITDVRKKHIKFLGYEFKMIQGKARRGYIPRTIPDRDRLKRKADKIAEDIKKIPRNYSREPTAKSEGLSNIINAVHG